MSTASPPIATTTPSTSVSRTIITSLSGAPDVPSSRSTQPSSPTPNSPTTTPSAPAPKGKTPVGGIVGALFGGLLAGVLVSIAVFFFLRSRRRRDRNANVMTYNSGYSSGWEEEKKRLLVQLDDAHSERVQLRTYLQLSDTRDPRDVVELFDKLNVSIKNSCLLASTSVLKSVQLRPSWTTMDASNLGQLRQDLDGAATLVISERGTGRRAEDFLPLAFCFIVNLTLVNNLFGLFHPGVSKEENKLLLDTYRDIRRRDAQRLSARWRCLTYSAIDSHIPPSGDWANRFADDVLNNLASIFSSLFGTFPSTSFPPKFRAELVSIGTEAYKWNSAVKSTFKALDFRPVLFASGDPFDPASMSLYLSHKTEKIPRNIVSAVSLALMSTSSEASGEEIKEEYVWQTKAEVVTEGFF